MMNNPNTSPAFLTTVLRSLALGLTLAGEYLLACNLITYYQLNLSFFPSAKYVVAAMIALLLPFFFEFLFGGTISLRKRAGVINWLLLLPVVGLIVSLALFRHLGDSLTTGLSGGGLSSAGATAALQVSAQLMDSPFASFSYALLSLLVPVASARLLHRLHNDFEAFRDARLLHRLLAARLEQNELIAKIAQLEAGDRLLTRELQSLEAGKQRAFRFRQLILWARQQGNGQVPPDPRELPGFQPETTTPADTTTGTTAVADLIRTDKLPLNSFLSFLGLILLGLQFTACSETPVQPAPENVLYLYDRSASLASAGAPETEKTARWLAEDATAGTTVHFACIYQHTAQLLPLVEPFRLPTPPVPGHNNFINQAVASDHARQIDRSRDSVLRRLRHALTQTLRSPYTDLFGTLALAPTMNVRKIRLWSDMLHDPGPGQPFAFRFPHARKAAEQGVSDAQAYVRKTGNERPLAGVTVSVCQPLPAAQTLQGKAHPFLRNYWEAFFQTAGAPQIQWETLSL